MAGKAETDRTATFKRFKRMLTKRSGRKGRAS